MSCRSGVSDRRGGVHEVEGEIGAVVAVVFGDELYFFGLSERYVNTLDESVSLHLRVCHKPASDARQSFGLTLYNAAPCCASSTTCMVIFVPT